MRTFKFDLTNFSAVGITNGRNGDVFGVHGSNGNRMDERAQNNTAEGVYIDDIVVGFAERGEMVWGSTQADAIAAFPANNQYAGLGNTFGTPQVELGAYQLTVRTAAEYGIQDGANIGLARSFNTNARLAQQVGIQVAANAAGTIRDGITFTLSDGFNQSTFEFDVTVGTGDISTGVTPGNIPVRVATNATPTQIATAIRDAINSPTAQLSLKLTASLQGEMTFGSVFGDAAAAGGTLVLLHGDAAGIRTGNLTFANTQHFRLFVPEWSRRSSILKAETLAKTSAMSNVNANKAKFYCSATRSLIVRTLVLSAMLVPETNRPSVERSDRDLILVRQFRRQRLTSPTWPQVL